MISEAEFSVKCVGSLISCLRLYCFISSAILLLFEFILTLKSAVIMVSATFVLWALSTLADIKLKYSLLLLGGR